MFSDAGLRKRTLNAENVPAATGGIRIGKSRTTNLGETDDLNRISISGYAEAHSCWELLTMGIQEYLL